MTAGLGTRLRPLTRDRAKPALPVAGSTLVERLLAALRAQGITDVLLNLHYCPASITRIVGDGGGCAVRVRYSWEVPLLGSGGGPRRAFALVGDDRLWLVNGDTFTEVDMAAMAGDHGDSDALVTMAVIPNPAPERYGGVLVDEDGAVTGFVRRGSPGPSWHFVGVQIAEREAFASIPDGVPADSVGPLYRSLIAGRRGAVRAFRSHATFLDIGTPRDYLDACLRIGGGPLVAGADFRATPNTVLDGCVIWDRVLIGSGVHLRRAIVGDDVELPDGFQSEHVVILKGSSGLDITPLV